MPSVPTEGAAVTSQLTRSDIARWRLHTLGLVGSRFVSPVDVVATLGLLDDGELLRTMYCARRGTT